MEIRLNWEVYERSSQKVQFSGLTQEHAGTLAKQLNEGATDYPYSFRINRRQYWIELVDRREEP